MTIEPCRQVDRETDNGLPYVEIIHSVPCTCEPITIGSLTIGGHSYPVDPLPEPRVFTVDEKPCKMESCEPGPAHVTIKPWSPKEVSELQAAIDADDDPEPRPLTVADLADIERRADITDTIDYVCDEATMADLRRLLAEVKRIHAKVHERSAAIEGRPMDDGELVSIRTTYENHLARGNYVHPMTHDVGRLLGEVDRLRRYLPVVADRADKNADQVSRMFDRMREVENEAMRRGVTTLPVPADGRTQWFTLASLGSQLTAVIDGKPYPYPEPGQDTGDFARDQLARAAAAALWTLLLHAIETEDEHHFETFTEALINHDRIPAAAANVIGPPLADLINAMLPVITTSLKAEGTS